MKQSEIVKKIEDFIEKEFKIRASIEINTDDTIMYDANNYTQIKKGDDITVKFYFPYTEKKK